MFQQFKNIFPNASLNIRSITESVGLNDSEWNRGRERLEALKNEFQSFNSILLNRQDSSDSISNISNTTTIERESIRELKATQQVVDKLDEGWNTIHEKNQSNIGKAQKADLLLQKLQSTGQLHDQVCAKMETTNQDLIYIKTNLEEITSSTVKLMKVLTELEDKIDQASIDYEKNQFELWKKEQKQDLMAEKLKGQQLLAEKEAKLKQQYEEYDSIQQKKRLELYEANFNAELEDYKRRRETEVSSLYSHHSNATEVTTSLDQLQLDDTEDLDQFLGTEKKKGKSHRLSISSASEDDGDNRIEILADEDYYEEV